MLESLHRIEGLLEERVGPHGSSENLHRALRDPAAYSQHKNLSSQFHRSESRYDISPLGTGKNWVTEVGGLPTMARAIAHALIRSGHSESTAIATAIAALKRWAAGGGNVHPSTRARAAAAVAEWEAKKAASHAIPNKRDQALAILERRVGPHGFIHGWIKVGEEAQKQGYPRVPTAHPKVQEAIANLQVGEGAARIMKSFQRGWDKSNLAAPVSSEETMKVAGPLYHVSPTSNRESIQRQGLKPFKDKVYLTKIPNTYAIDPEQDTYEVDTTGLEFKPDPNDKFGAYYTAQHIEPKRLKLTTKPRRSAV